jgi:hypothetical protein
MTYLVDSNNGIPPRGEIRINSYSFGERRNIVKIHTMEFVIVYKSSKRLPLESTT